MTTRTGNTPSGWCLARVLGAVGKWLLPTPRLEELRTKALLDDNRHDKPSGGRYKMEKLKQVTPGSARD